MWNPPFGRSFCVADFAVCLLVYTNVGNSTPTCICRQPVHTFIPIAAHKRIIPSGYHAYDRYFFLFSVCEPMASLISAEMLCFSYKLVFATV